MRKIICYGDSNTFGFNPKDASRYNEQTRWTGILQTKFGNDYKIIEEGASDRTGFVNNPKGFLFSAPQHFPDFISKSDNIDLLILWIGTNDLQFQYDISFSTIENGLENLIKLAETKAEKIIIIPPVMLNEKVLEGYFKFQFDKTSIIKSQKVEKIYIKLANDYNCRIFNINKFTNPSDLDGLHYDENSHKIIANKLTAYIKNNNTIC